MTKIEILSAGSFWTDAGASFGNLPRSIWGRFLHIDEKHRMPLNLNLLLIKEEGKNIIVDTGIGNKLSDKMIKIFKPQLRSFEDLLNEHNLMPTDITDVIMTHLHFDHAGGIVSYDNNKNPYLTFPHATYHIQEKEWNIAKNPDELNMAAYDYDNNLALLEKEGKINLINGDYQVSNAVKVLFVGGHSEGMQSVEIITDNKKYIYAGDIIPSSTFLKLSITSAYDVCRRDTFKAKKMILNKVVNEDYTLIYDHSTKELYYEKEND
jgi:glyoxylase-like metal-dependent hydrolase (beta-lactamase superfamily II)